MTPEGRKFELVLHPVPEKPAKSGVEAHDLDGKRASSHRSRKKWATDSRCHGPRWRRRHALTVSGRRPITSRWPCATAIPSGSRAGNWQSSNQPDVHPFADPPGSLPPSFQRKYNRDYHAVIENETLAAAYQTYIKRDYELTATAAAPESFALPDLFVPEEEEEAIEFAEPPNSFNRCDWSGN